MHEPSAHTGDSETQRSTTAKRRLPTALLLGIVSMTLLLGFTLGLLLAGSSGLSRFNSPALYDEEQVTTLFERASPAVVEISVNSAVANLLGQSDGAGSGFLVDSEGHIVTNLHVVEGADEISVNLSNGKTLQAVVLGTSPADDLAVVKVDAAEVVGIAPLPLADSDDVRPGQMAIAIGSPYRNFNSVGVGVVSGTGRGPTSVLRRPIPHMIQTDVPLNPGNSGGPLLNSKGDVIGVTSSVRIGAISGVEEYRIGFAVPSNTLKSLMPQLVTVQQVRRPWLGISGAPLTEDLIRVVGIDEGIFITRVFGGSPAENAGLTPFLGLANRGDIITAIDGTPVGSVEDMVSYFNTLQPGDHVTLSVVRDALDLAIDVTLAQWPER